MISYARLGNQRETFELSQQLQFLMWKNYDKYFSSNINKQKQLQ